jgi:hydroxyacylglutathione hydrolase
MKIKIIPALYDNYIFLLYDLTQKVAAVVDPAESSPVFQSLRELDLKLTAIFNTHHHGDHIGGNLKLKEAFPELRIYAGGHDRGRIPGQEIFLEQGERIFFTDREAQVYYVPGHTQGHIAYYFPPHSEGGAGELFCGDTMFAGGCGKLLEGTPQEMVNSLEQLRQLPGNTNIWCAHEYTLKNLEFALTLEPNNDVLKKRFSQAQRTRLDGQPTIPSLLKLEKQTNPFLRWDQPTIQKITNLKEPAKVFAKIRQMKDLF